MASGSCGSTSSAASSPVSGSAETIRSEDPRATDHRLGDGESEPPYSEGHTSATDPVSSAIFCVRESSRRDSRGVASVLVSG